MNQGVHDAKAIQLPCTPFSDMGIRETFLCGLVTEKVVCNVKATTNLGMFLLLSLTV